jgi:tRNA (guanine37-N1)-methyltransferase
MLMKVQPVADAILAAKEAANAAGVKPRVVYLSPQGRPLNQQKVESMAQQDGLILLAGRYEGIDERLISSMIDEECSIGDYVLSGGELAAMVLMDTVIRQLPGALGHELSAQQDSFSSFNKGLLDCPHYTRPEQLDGEKVPEVLLSGNHEKISQWRLKQSLGRTWQRRPELLQQLSEQGSLSKNEQLMLDEFIAETKNN